ncbi:abc transporter atp-binding protein [Leptolyngbya sp. Heron Island J]|uniref:metal ABC transporter ATP-binding protein n=1 Tax=Leptolyngbya sp. Heron Island J TaxID=1385935 RepID=UPI0003B9BFD0|nr:metal ABC transporter ATP-binding protein [Leptolyngbya sp. Heron Island J]ESA37709.1 abc transporter atp-binding protein [Leptolyngbya sp. Heron Island J]
MSDPVLVVNELTVYRETYAAVQNVSFTVPAGMDTAIVGPNGAGKSTLIQAVLGILPHRSGEVFVLGQPLSPKGHLSAAVRQQIAYLPQNFLFDRRIPITVRELVGLGWDRLGLQFPWTGGRARRHAVQQALTQVDAWYLRHKLVSTLSGGELKRVLLAYCLVRPRRLLILDEAPAGLDVRSESEFYRLLHQLKKEQGWAILQVSHDLDMVRRSCDRVLCINRALLCQGPPDNSLTPENLSLAYGSEFVRYHHSC